MGDFGTNCAEIRGSSCGFPAAGHNKKVKASEGRVLLAGEGKKIPPGSGDTPALDICGQETCNSSGVGGPTDYF